METSYKEKYEQALAKAKEQYNYPCMRSCMGILEEIFPELKESEDEKVRKEIVRFIQMEVEDEIVGNKWLAWLERQGEHANFRNKIQVGDKVTRNEDGVLVNLSQLKRVAKPSERRGEQEKDILEDAILDSNEDGLIAETIRYKNEKQEMSYTKKDVDDAYLKGARDAKNEIEKQYEANYQTRKDIATFIFNYKGDIKDRAKWIDYLGVKVSFVEKQGKQKHENICSDCTNRKGCINCEDGNMKETLAQKPADKIEPKFHEGEWVVNKLGDLWHIDSFNKKNYQVSDGKGNYNYFPISKQGEMRLWTIQDAKDGDVLACPNDAGDRDVVFIFKNINSNEGWVFCFCASDANGCFCTNNDYVGNSNSTNISPATKEQRDLLFHKMNEAGYTFDFENKKLKKIEPKPEENKGNLGGISANWSEEDDKVRTTIINEFEQCSEWCCANGLTKEDCIDWLQLLKNRVQPKQEWNEEDERNLQGVIDEIEANKNQAPDYDLATYDRFLSWLQSLRPQK